MADTEDGVASIATQDSLDKDEEKFLPVSRDDEKQLVGKTKFTKSKKDV